MKGLNPVLKHFCGHWLLRLVRHHLNVRGEGVQALDRHIYKNTHTHTHSCRLSWKYPPQSAEKRLKSTKHWFQGLPSRMSSSRAGEKYQPACKMLPLCLLLPLLLLPSGATTALSPEGGLAGHESGVSSLTRLRAHPLVSCPFPWQIWPPRGSPSSLWLSVCTGQTAGLGFAVCPSAALCCDVHMDHWLTIFSH